jgi:protein-tyrosine phosphatase
MSEQDRIGVLFVCMGNICRSPLAEALFHHHAEADGVLHRFAIDSAGTGGWHEGEPPDGRMAVVAASRGVHLSGEARQLTADDLDRFQHVMCMDGDNLHRTRQLGRDSASVELMLAHYGEIADMNVPDPYYGGPEGFDRVFELLDVSCRNLVRSLIQHYDSVG